MTQVQRQCLDRCGVPLLSCALDVWQSRKHDLAAYRSSDIGGHIQIAVDDGMDLPRFLFVGSDSTLAQVFGASYVKNIMGKRGTPDKEYTYSVNSRYREVAWCQRPALDRIVSRIGNEYIDYTRFIAPVDLKDFGSGFATFTVIHRRFRSLTTAHDTAALAQPEPAISPAGNLAHSPIPSRTAEQRRSPPEC